MINISNIVHETYVVTYNNCRLAQENLNTVSNAYSVSLNIAKYPTGPFNDKFHHSSEKVDSDDEYSKLSPIVKRKRKCILVFDGDDDFDSHEATSAKQSKQTNQILQ